jgi:prolyl 4-hydroxylase
LNQSHTTLHGRPFPLKGKVFANIFVHFEPVDHAQMNVKAMAELKQKGLPVHKYEEEEEEEEEEAPVMDAKEEARLRINFACSGNRLGEVQAILRADPDAINTADKNGWQPLHEAVRGGHTNLVKYLVDMGADMGAVTNGGGTPLWWAKRLLSPGHSTIQYLLEVGAPEQGNGQAVL